MRSFNVILALVFTLTASSYAWPGTSYHTLEVRRNGTKSNDPKRALQKSCKKMRHLNALSQLVANQTKLDAWVADGKLDTAAADALNAKAANATAELQTMQANSTLVSECAVVDAERKSVSQCKQMNRLTKLAALAGNETALAAYEQKKELNETSVEKLKIMISEAETKLKDMQANTTLADFCTQRQQQQKGGVSDSGDTAAGQAQQTTGGAPGFTAQGMPFVVVPALAAVFTMFL